MDILESCLYDQFGANFDLHMESTYWTILNRAFGYSQDRANFKAFYFLLLDMK